MKWLLPIFITILTSLSFIAGTGDCPNDLQKKMFGPSLFGIQRGIARLLKPIPRTFAGFEAVYTDRLKVDLGTLIAWMNKCKIPKKERADLHNLVEYANNFVKFADELNADNYESDHIIISIGQKLQQISKIYRAVADRKRTADEAYQLAGTFFLSDTDVKMYGHTLLGMQRGLARLSPIPKTILEIETIYKEQQLGGHLDYLIYLMENVPVPDTKKNVYALRDLAKEFNKIAKKLSTKAISHTSISSIREKVEGMLKIFHAAAAIKQMSDQENEVASKFFPD